METLKSIYNRLLSQEASIHEATDAERQTIQSVAIEMLDDLIRVCDQYGLTLLLGGGSCLGAVRHDGFIPWDDDMDFNMPRDDYETLKSIFESELGEKYILHSPNYKKGKAQSRFGRIEKKETLLLDSNDREQCHGICIDIFPIEKIPQNKIHRYIHGIVIEGVMFAAGQVWFAKESTQIFRTALKHSNKLRYYSKKITGDILGICPLYKWYDLVDHCCQYKGKTNLMGVPTGRKHYFGEIFDASVYLPQKETLFEGHKAYLPNKEDDYLKNLFGDYMKIPPVDKREHHYIYGVEIEGRRI